MGYSLTGTMPQADDEIAITELMYRQLNYAGYSNRETGESVQAGELTMNEQDAKSIIGKRLTLRIGGEEKSWKVTGVVDTCFDYERYADFVPKENVGAPTDGQSDIGTITMQG